MVSQIKLIQAKLTGSSLCAIKDVSLLLVYVNDSSTKPTQNDDAINKGSQNIPTYPTAKPRTYTPCKAQHDLGIQPSNLARNTTSHPLQNALQSKTYPLYLKNTRRMYIHPSPILHHSPNKCRPSSPDSAPTPPSTSSTTAADRSPPC